MYGAILGDMIGAPYEFDQGEKTKDFELFNPRKWVRYTDLAELLMRSDLPTIMWKAARRPFRKQWQHFLKELILRTLYAMEYHSVEIVIRSPA